MNQISLRMTKEDMQILKLIADDMNSPLASVYRQATYKAFNEWKIDQIFYFYSKGSFGLKKAWKLSSMPWNEFLLELERRDIEPPIPEMIDRYTDKIRDEIKLKDHKK